MPDGVSAWRTAERGQKGVCEAGGCSSLLATEGCAGQMTTEQTLVEAMGREGTFRWREVPGGGTGRVMAGQQKATGPGRSGQRGREEIWPKGWSETAIGKAGA